MINIELCGYSLIKGGQLRQKIFLLFGDEDEEVHITINSNSVVDRYQHEHPFIRLYTTIARYTNAGSRIIDKLGSLKTVIEWVHLQARIEPS